MRLVVDLHSHSGHSGGVGDLPLPEVAATMRKKGIDLFGTGDCLQPDWRGHLKAALAEREPGFFALADGSEDGARARFVLQTEIILTAALPSGARKGVHFLFLFPGFAEAEAAAALLLGWGAKLGIGRPFLVCADPDEVAERLDRIAAIDPRILFIPAHVMTPQGIFGSEAPVDRLADFFGAFAPRLDAFETGLSADPRILSLIPELDGKTLLSNSDCHSAALHRVGREFSVLEVADRSYAGMAEAIRAGRVTATTEFSPAEGRYFLTGHRGGRDGHAPTAACRFSPDTTPPDRLCPICGKPLTVGVLERALELSRLQGAHRTLDQARPRQASVTVVPLVEILACALGVKNPASAKVLRAYEAILARLGTEADLWLLAPESLARALEGAAPESTLKAILDVRAGRFRFSPLGFDGVYGALELGEPDGWFGIREVTA